MDKNSVENENVGPRVKASSHKTKKRPCGVVHGAWMWFSVRSVCLSENRCSSGSGLSSTRAKRTQRKPSHALH